MDEKIYIYGHNIWNFCIKNKNVKDDSIVSSKIFRVHLVHLQVYSKL